MGRARLLVCLLVVALYADVTKGAARSFSKNGKAIAMKNFRSLNTNIQWDRWLVNLAGASSDCSDVGRQGPVTITKRSRTPQGDSFAGFVDSTPGDGKDADTVTNYIETVIGAWPTRYEFRTQIEQAKKVGCSVKPGCRRNALIVCVFSPAVGGSGSSGRWPPNNRNNQPDDRVGIEPVDPRYNQPRREPGDRYRTQPVDPRRYQPDAPRYSQPDGEVRIQPVDPRYNQPDGEVRIQPVDPRYNQPDGEVRIQPVDPRYNQPDGEVRIQPVDPRYNQPDGEVRIQPVDPRYNQPDGEVRIQPVDPRYNQPDGEVRIQPFDPRYSQPRREPDDRYRIQPVDPRRNQPDGEARIQPVDPWYDQPRRGQPDRNQPDGEVRSQPVDPRRNQPDGEARIQPVDPWYDQPRGGQPDNTYRIQPVGPRHSQPDGEARIQPVDPRYYNPPTDPWQRNQTSGQQESRGSYGHSQPGSRRTVNYQGGRVPFEKVDDPRSGQPHLSRKELRKRQREERKRRKHQARMDGDIYDRMISDGVMMSDDPNAQLGNMDGAEFRHYMRKYDASHHLPRAPQQLKVHKHHRHQ